MKSEVVVVRGTNSKPVSSQSLAKFFAANGGYQGQLFIGYPIIGTPEGAYPIDALWVSPKTGIVIFDLIEGNDPDDFRERQDDAANKLEAKLKAHRELTEKRALLVPIHTLSLAPAIGDKGRYSDEEYPLCNVETLREALSQFKWKQENGLYTVALSAIQSMSTIRRSRSKRIPKREDSR